MEGRKKHFVIVTSGRTGSTAIVKWLNSSNLIRCHNEVFLSYHSESRDSFGYYVSKVLKRPWLYKLGLHWRIAGKEGRKISIKYVYQFMESLFSDPKFSAPWKDLNKKSVYNKNEFYETEKLVGFKVGYTQYYSLYGLRKWIREQDIYIIHLSRKNLLKKHISKKMADLTSVWHSQNKVNDAKLKLDIPFAISRIEAANKMVNEMNEDFKVANKNVLEIYYEDFLDLSKRKVLAQQLAEFFGEDFETFGNLETSMKKLNSNKLSDILSNYEEVKESFTNSPYKHFLD